MSELMQTGFDYAALPVESVDRLQTIKRDIAIIDTLACVQIGQKLKEAQAELNMRGKSGAGFVDWVEAETPYGRQAAYDMINIANRFSGNDFQFIGNHFSQTVLARLAAPSTPESVVDRAIEKAESGAKVTVAEVKQWKEAAQAATQRAEEFRVESNERRKTIRALEAQVDLLKNQPPPEPERVYVTPADYDTIKAEAARLRQQLDAIEARKDQLVQQQVVAKLKEREREIESLEQRANQLKGTIDSYQSHIARVHLPEMEMQQQIKVVEEFMRACAGLAAGLAMFEHAPNAATASIWHKGIAAASDAAHAMRLHVERRPELCVIHGAPQAA